jgi:argonaute-like protein implicated in RNA metabolism and viral defense
MLLNIGAYDRDCEVSFSGGSNGMIIKEGNQDALLSIKVNSVDNLNLEKVTSIKMDIEGLGKESVNGIDLNQDEGSVGLFWSR